MPRRQLIIFTIGCWAAFATAGLHLVGHMSGTAPPANDTERQLLDLATNYRFPLPGGSERAIMDLMSGFSLAFSVFLALAGGLGLVIRKRCADDGPTMLAAARALAGASVVLVTISLIYWFIVPSLMLGLMAFCFLFAAVRPPEREGAEGVRS